MTSLLMKARAMGARKAIVISTVENRGSSATKGIGSKTPRGAPMAGMKFSQNVNMPNTTESDTSRPTVGKGSTTDQEMKNLRRN